MYMDPHFRPVMATQSPNFRTLDQCCVSPVGPTGLSCSCQFLELSHDILWSKKLWRGKNRFCAMLYQWCLKVHWGHYGQLVPAVLTATGNKTKLMP